VPVTAAFTAFTRTFVVADLITLPLPAYVVCCSLLPYLIAHVARYLDFPLQFYYAFARIFVVLTRSTFAWINACLRVA